MLNRNLIITLLLALALMASLGGMNLAEAQPRGPRSQGYGPCGRLPAGIPAEKQEAIQKIVDSYQATLFDLHQEIYTKRAQLEAAMAQAQPDTAKAQAISKEIGELKSKAMNVRIEMRAQVTKETGIRLPGFHGRGMGGGFAGAGCIGGGWGNPGPRDGRWGWRHHGYAPDTTPQPN